MNPLVVGRDVLFSVPGEPIPRTVPFPVDLKPRVQVRPAADDKWLVFVETATDRLQVASFPPKRLLFNGKGKPLQLFREGRVYTDAPLRPTHWLSILDAPEEVEPQPPPRGVTWVQSLQALGTLAYVNAATDVISRQLQTVDRQTAVMIGLAAAALPIAFIWLWRRGRLIGFTAPRANLAIAKRWTAGSVIGIVIPPSDLVFAQDAFQLFRRQDGTFLLKRHDLLKTVDEPLSAAAQRALRAATEPQLDLRRASVPGWFGSRVQQTVLWMLTTRDQTIKLCRLLPRYRLVTYEATRLSDRPRKLLITDKYAIALYIDQDDDRWNLGVLVHNTATQTTIVPETADLPDTTHEAPAILSVTLVGEDELRVVLQLYPEGQRVLTVPLA
jgi:hypothetical protein